MLRWTIALLVSTIIPSTSLAADDWRWGANVASLVKQGAVRLSPSEVRLLIVGKTETWWKDNSGRNAAYYAPNGNLYIRYLGKRTEETWQIEPDGSVCYSRCHYYIRFKGSVVMVYDGKTVGHKRYMSGNRL